MKKSTKSRRSNKPPKPYDGFPLFLHASGRWAKKIRGNLYYFGRWGNKRGSKVVPVEDVAESAQEALDLYELQRDDLYAGRTPRKSAEGLTVSLLCNQFLNGKRMLMESGEIRPRTFQEYYDACGKLVAAFGKNRLVDDLAADDFGTLRGKLAIGRGPVSLGKDVRLVRMVFKYGFDSGLIEKPIRYGQSFNAPSKRVIRESRNGNGKRMFEAAELRRILDALDGKVQIEVDANDENGRPTKKRKTLKAEPILKAMVFLGANCGFGQTDIANLPQSALDLKKGWVDYPRPKTAVERRNPLWPKTVKALREAIKLRPEPIDAADDRLVFLTRRGDRWVRVSNGEKQRWKDAIGLEFGKLLRKLGLKRPGLNFYALRHTFETIGGESRDQVAVNAIMGHVDSSMAGVYRERISDERLRAVTETVREWLWPSGTV